MGKFYSLTQQYEYEPTRIVLFSQLKRGELFFLTDLYTLGDRKLYLKSHNNYAVSLGTNDVIGSNLRPNKWIKEKNIQDRECIRVSVVDTQFKEDVNLSKLKHIYLETYAYKFYGSNETPMTFEEWLKIHEK